MKRRQLAFAFILSAVLNLSQKDLKIAFKHHKSFLLLFGSKSKNYFSLINTNLLFKTNNIYQ